MKLFTFECVTFYITKRITDYRVARRLLFFFLPFFFFKKKKLITDININNKEEELFFVWHFYLGNELQVSRSVTMQIQSGRNSSVCWRDILCYLPEISVFIITCHFCSFFCLPWLNHIHSVHTLQISILLQDIAGYADIKNFSVIARVLHAIGNKLSCQSWLQHWCLCACHQSLDSLVI